LATHVKNIFLLLSTIEPHNDHGDD